MNSLENGLFLKNSRKKKKTLYKLAKDSIFFIIEIGIVVSSSELNWMIRIETDLENDTSANKLNETILLRINAKRSSRPTWCDENDFDFDRPWAFFFDEWISLIIRKYATNRINAGRIEDVIALVFLKHIIIKNRLYKHINKGFKYILS